MKPTYPLPVHHSWALYERARQFELGQLHDYDSLDAEPMIADALSTPRARGVWTCDLSNDSLVWSSQVYTIFGFPDGACISRDEAVARYAEASRAAMEKLRAYAIKHRRGFTLDAEIDPAAGPRRWMRLIAEPVCVDDRVVGLRGLKLLLPFSN